MRFCWLDAPNQTVHTRDGQQRTYDALLLALGARTRPLFKHATTVHGGRMSTHLRELLTELESGALRRIAAIIPTRSGWPLPMYELVLLLMSAARSRGIELEITLASAEDVAAGGVRDARRRRGGGTAWRRGHPDRDVGEL